MNEAPIDTSGVSSLLSSLAAEVKDGMLLKALQKGGKALQEQTQRQLLTSLPAANHPTHTHVGTRTTHGPMVKGVTNKTDKAYSEVRISILGDFRLKWFETGTKERTLKRTGAKDRSRGRYRGDRRYLHRKKGKENFYKAGSPRGRIRPLRFFATARADDTVVTAAIEKEFYSRLQKYTS